MSKRRFYLWLLWDLCFLCIGAADIYRYIVRDDGVMAFICGSVINNTALYCIYHSIEKRNKDDKESVVSYLGFPGCCYGG